MVVSSLLGANESTAWDSRCVVAAILVTVIRLVWPAKQNNMAIA